MMNTRRAMLRLGPAVVIVAAFAACPVPLPPPNTDGDAFVDPQDRCPREPEDPDGFEDGDGCPDPDNDADGIGDDDDRCPNQPEDYDGHSDADGCPEDEVDSDGDGVFDAEDRCPDEAEDRDRFRDDDGCPDTDNDEDGIDDTADSCPDEAEVINGIDDEDGCPDQGLAHVERDRIVLEEILHFEFGTAVLRPESLDVLEAVARLLEVHPEYSHVSIHGYTDYQGDEDFNLQLSQRRADRIRNTLIRMGIAPDRLDARGFGEAEPLADGQTIAANRENRRVEFVITRE